MNKPVIFVSSTIFDLQPVRDNLRLFLESYGFELIMSEYGEVFFNPKNHTHKACVDDVKKCDIFILIIGKRSGGEYHDNTLKNMPKSVTKAEYDQAYQEGKYIITLVDKDLETIRPIFFQIINQHIQNYDEDKVKQIENFFVINNKKEKDKINKLIPNINNPLLVFHFYETIMKQESNNAIGFFSNYLDIERYIKNQLLGFIFDFFHPNIIHDHVGSKVLSQYFIPLNIPKLVKKTIKDLPIELNDYINSSESPFDDKHIFESERQEDKICKAYMKKTPKKISIHQTRISTFVAIVNKSKTKIILLDRSKEQSCEIINNRYDIFGSVQYDNPSILTKLPSIILESEVLSQELIPCLVIEENAYSNNKYSETVIMIGRILCIDDTVFDEVDSKYSDEFRKKNLSCIEISKVDTYNCTAKAQSVIKFLKV